MTAAREETVIVAGAANGAYALPLTVMLHSVLQHLDPACRLEAYVVDDGIAAADKLRLARSLTERATVHWVAPRRGTFAGLPLWGRMTVTTYDKLLVADLVPAETPRVVWLDADLLVLRDLAALWRADLDGRHALAVADRFVPSVASRFGVAPWAELGISDAAKYFNAGVVLIDCVRWRRDDVAGQALAYLQRYRDRVVFWDQEALNAVLAGRWGELDPRWNVMLGHDHPPLPADEHDATAPWILHFSGNLKPWTHGGNGPYHALYLDYLDRTEWAGWRPPRSWWSDLLARYESSALRRLLYPTERWGMRALRWATLRYTSEKGQ